MKYLLIIFYIIFFSATAYAKPEVTLLTKDNFVSLVGEVDDTSINNLIKGVQTSKSKDVIVYIESPGGSVRSGFSFLQYLETTDKHIICVADVAISMAHSIFESCPDRLVTSSSVLMQHNVTGGASGKIISMQRLLSIMSKEEAQMDRAEANRLKMPLEKFIIMIKDEWWVYGEDALDVNMADKVTEIKCADELYTSDTIQPVSLGNFMVKVKFNGCPLIKPSLVTDSDSSRELITKYNLVDEFNKYFGIDLFKNGDLK